MNPSPVFVKTYDLLLWLIPEVQRFPRVHRFGLGERVQRTALDFQESLIAAGKSQGSTRAAWLHTADIQLEQLRLWLRLAQELNLLSLEKYEHAARLLAETGRLLGGWLKHPS